MSKPVNTVLVPLDGSATAEGVLEPTERLTADHPSTVYLLRVLEQAEGQPDRDTSIEDARAYLAQVEKRYAAKDRTFELHVRAGEAASTIIDMAEEIGVDLIAMSTHGRTGVERWVRGSVAERVLRNASIPLLLVNPFGRVQWETQFERVLVPLDGSIRSEAALPLASGIAEHLGKKLVLFHVLPPDADEPTPNVRERFERLRAEGHACVFAAGQGAAADAILEATEEGEGVLLAMTTHGWTGLHRWAFGSVAESVLRRCRFPLLVLRPGKP